MANGLLDTKHINNDLNKNIDLSVDNKFTESELLGQISNSNKPNTTTHYNNNCTGNINGGLLDVKTK